VKGDALHELHGVEVPSLGIHPEIMHRHNVRVCQAAEHAGFQLEALALLRAGGGAQHHLHRDRPAQLLILGAEDCAHATPRDLVPGAVVARLWQVRQREREQPARAALFGLAGCHRCIVRVGHDVMRRILPAWPEGTTAISSGGRAGG